MKRTGIEALIKVRLYALTELRMKGISSEESRATLPAMGRAG